MLICLEGVDGAGKSTLAKQIKRSIQEQYPDDTVEIIHAAQIEEDVYTSYADPLCDYEPQSGHHIILDRWHIGELIYGPLYRKKSEFDRASFAWVDLYLASKGLRLWTITQELSVLEARLKARGEDYLQDKDVEFVNEQFKELSPRSACFAKTIAPLPEDVPALADHMVLDAQYAELRAANFSKWGVTYVGPTYMNPQTVLVVDNTRKNKAFIPDRSDEANLFWDAVPRAMQPKTATVSSVSQDKLHEFLEELHHTTGVIAYGETVSARLRDRGIAHIKIDPPSDRFDYERHLSISMTEAGEQD